MGQWRGRQRECSHRLGCMPAGVGAGTSNSTGSLMEGAGAWGLEPSPADFPGYAFIGNWSQRGGGTWTQALRCIPVPAFECLPFPPHHLMVSGLTLRILWIGLCVEYEVVSVCGYLIYSVWFNEEDALFQMNVLGLFVGNHLVLDVRVCSHTRTMLFPLL